MAHPQAPERLTARCDWTVWSTTASLVVGRPDAISEARSLAHDVLTRVEAACSRFDDDSELSRITAEGRAQAGVEVSPLLAALISTALTVAEKTEGSVDPTLGEDLSRWGYDRDFGEMPAVSAEATFNRPFSVSVTRRVPGWRSLRLDGRVLTVPAHVRIDLGATAKAFAAELIAQRVAGELDTGVLVSLGGDIATAGANGRGGWEVLVQDVATDPAQQVFLPDGAAIATSSTQKRRWVRDGRVLQHILDPATGAPVVPHWRSVSVAASDCVHANALSTAAIVRGSTAPRWLADQEAAARLVDLTGRVTTTGAWPRADEATGGAR